MTKYDFYDDSMPSFTDICNAVEADQGLPFDKRRAIIEAMNALIIAARSVEARFALLDPTRLVCNYATVEGLINRLIESDASRAHAMANVFEGCRFVIDRCDLRHPPKMISFSLTAKKLAMLVADTYASGQLKRCFYFLSSHCMTEEGISDLLMLEFRQALWLDPSVKRPEQIWLNTLRTFNKARSLPGWPQVKLALPLQRKAKGPPWASFPASLKPDVEMRLQRTPRFVTWDDNVRAAVARTPRGLAHGVELVRICAGALVESGIPLESVVSIRDIVLPENFLRIADTLFLRAGRRVTRLSRTKLVTLRTLAARSGVLDASELEAVDKVLHDNMRSHRKFLKNNRSRLESRLAEFRHPDVVRELRCLPMRAAGRIEPLPITRPVAAEMKQAATLGLRLDTGLPSVLIPLLEYDRHFTELGGDLTGCLRLYVPASETSNKIAREGVICPEYAAIIRAFRAKYRPHLDLTGQSAFLFPGVTPKPLQAITISAQQCRFLRENFHERFTPEVIRAITRDLILREDPAATGLLADSLGFRDREYLLRLATPYQERQARQKVADLAASGQLE